MKHDVSIRTMNWAPTNQRNAKDFKWVVKDLSHVGLGDVVRRVQEEQPGQNEDDVAAKK